MSIIPLFAITALGADNSGLIARGQGGHHGEFNHGNGVAHPAAFNRGMEAGAMEGAAAGEVGSVIAPVYAPPVQPAAPTQTQIQYVPIQVTPTPSTATTVPTTTTTNPK